MSSVGSSCFLTLLFVSHCPSSIVSPPSPFLATGPRFGMTKGKIWLIVKFLVFFFSDTSLPFLSVYRSPSSRRREVDQGGAGRDEEKRSGIGTTKQRRRRQQRRSVLLFLYSFHSLLLLILLLSGCLFSTECNDRRSGTGRDQRLRRK